MAFLLLHNYTDFIYTGHCTGLSSFERLKARMGSQISYLAAGDTITV